MNRVGGFTLPLRAAIYVNLIGLLAATGIRIGEATKLDRTDIDWTVGVLQSPGIQVRHVPARCR
jgi:integrase